MWNQEESKTDSKTPTLGSSVFIKGEIAGAEDLTIEGEVEGKIDLPDHTLTVGPNATILATVNAKAVLVFGSVVGTINAKERVDVRKSGSIEGTVTCARIAVQEGAHVSGKVETKQSRGAKKSDSSKQHAA
jgi:cytoskeletal protein CcmA (bactofilin family)